jgi:hypothetical protein
VPALLSAYAPVQRLHYCDMRQRIAAAYAE